MKTNYLDFVCTKHLYGKDVRGGNSDGIHATSQEENKPFGIRSGIVDTENSSHTPYLSNHCFHTWELHVVYMITPVPAPGPFVQTCVHRTRVRLGNFLTPVPLRSSEQRNREDIRIWEVNLDFSLRA